MDIPTFSHLIYAAQLSLGIVFLLSALLKMRRPHDFAKRVVEYKVLQTSIAYGLGWTLIPLEALLAMALLTSNWTVVALPLAAVLLAAFLGAVALNLARGRRIPCGCFGAESEQISTRTLVRLLLLLTVALLLVVYRSVESEPLPSIGSTVADGSAVAYAVDVAALSAFLVLLGAWALSLPELALLARHPRQLQPPYGAPE